MENRDEDVYSEWEEGERSGQWTPPVDNALAGCRFAKVGFRSYELIPNGGQWKLLLSRVDSLDREPKGVVTVYAPGHPVAFPEQDGFVMSRSLSIFSSRNLADVGRALEARLGDDDESWVRRLDYLAVRSLRELQRQRSDEHSFEGQPSRPTGVQFVFDGRLRVRRANSLFGPGSSGKTTITGGLCVSLASGLEIIPDWRPVRRFRIGVLDWDEGYDEERVRIYAICRGHQVDDISGYRYRAQSRPLVDSADEIGRWVNEEGIEVLVVSPVNRAIRPTMGDPGAPVFELYDVLREFGTTNILIDHVVGAAVDKPDAIREYGSVAKRDAVRGSYSVYEQSSVAGSRVVVIRNTKPDALTPRRAPQAIRVEYDPPHPPNDGVYERITFSADEVAESTGSHPSARRETQPDKLVRLLREHGPMKAADLCALSGFPASNMREIARKARAKGFTVNFDVATTRYALSSSGEHE